MFLCYIDESGTSDIPGNTSHFVLAGLSVPIDQWKACDAQIEAIKGKYDLIGLEIHVAWILRPYHEQSRIPNFSRLSYSQRRLSVNTIRKQEILRLQRAKNVKLFKQTKKNYKNTASYIHLDFTERRQLIQDLSNCVAGWEFARLFAECVDKIHFDPHRAGRTVDEQAFEQIVSRFERYLQNVQDGYGLLIHDNNQTVALKHTELMKKYHNSGTLWTSVSHIVETPLFVDSQLTSMVQIADLCAYSLRRYLENHETALFDPIFQRADRKGATVVGVRHFTAPSCTCKICSLHRK